jgi:hypothetical protein
MLVSDEATELLARRFLDRPRPGPVSNPAPGGLTVLQQPEKPCVRVRNQVKLLAGTHDDPAELDDAPLSADRMFRLVRRGRRLIACGSLTSRKRRSSTS